MGTTTFVWDPVFDCVTHELDENNNVKAEYHNEPQPYGGVLSQRRGTTTHYHHHDALGSTRFLTDSSGNVTDTYLHDAWGNLIASTGTTINPFKWVGKYGYYTDNSTAQVYVRARMYQPTVARWVSQDPWINSYFDRMMYGSNGPVSNIDPTGFFHLKHYDVAGAGGSGKPSCGNFYWRTDFVFNDADIKKAPFALIQLVSMKFEIYDCEDCSGGPNLKIRTTKCPEAITSAKGAAEELEFLEVWSVIPDRKGGVKVYGGKPPSYPLDPSGAPLAEIHDVFSSSDGGAFTQTLKVPYVVRGLVFVVPLTGRGTIEDPYKIPGGWEIWRRDLFEKAKLGTAHAMCRDDAPPELKKAMKATFDKDDIVGFGRQLKQTWNCCSVEKTLSLETQYLPKDEETDVDLPI